MTIKEKNDIAKSVVIICNEYKSLMGKIAPYQRTEAELHVVNGDETYMTVLDTMNKTIDWIDLQSKTIIKWLDNR